MALLAGAPTRAMRASSCSSGTTTSIARLAAAPRGRRHAAAAAEAPTATAPEPPQQAPEAAAPAPAPAAAESTTSRKAQGGRRPRAPGRGRGGGRTSAPAEASSNLNIVRLSARSQATRTAAYMYSQLAEDTGTLCIEVIGAAACLKAVKTLAKLQDMVAAGMEGRCVSFQPQRHLSQSSSEGEGLLSGMRLYVQLASTQSWPAVAFDAELRPANRQAKKEQGGGGSDDAGGEEDPAGGGEEAASSSEQEQHQHEQEEARRVRPMLVRGGVGEDADTSGRLKGHALRSASAKRPAQFALFGTQRWLAVGAKLLLNELSFARLAATADDNLPERVFDLECTIASTTYKVQPRRQQQEGGSGSDSGSDSDSGSPAAAAAAEGETEQEPAPEAAAAGAEGGSAAGAADEARAPETRKRYVVTVRACEPSARVLAAAARRQPRGQPRQQQPQRGGGGSGGAREVRPGYVEVSQQEWEQLKEQLAVVPHLTEQLQIMTQQHTQLLSLLTAQQEQQEQGGEA